MLLTQTTNQPGARQRTLARSFHLGTVSVKFVFIGLLAAIALLYLAQSTQGAARANEFRLLEEQKKTLEEDQDRLEIEAARLKSLENLQKDFTTEPSAAGVPAAWERVREVSYLEAPQPVAQNQ